MRRIKDPQGVLDFQAPRLALTHDYYRRYAAIGALLDEAPEILRLAHADLSEAFEKTERERDRECPFNSDNVLRVCVVQMVEGLSLREAVIRVDDSAFLRRFVRVYDGEMMGHSTFCRLRNQIRPATWKKINRALTKHAFAHNWISGDDLRIDTTAFETNVHYPTDSSLLFDVYRTIARLVAAARKIDPRVAKDRRLHVRAAKRLHTKIARKVGKNTKAETLKPSYRALLGHVDGALRIGSEVVGQLASALDAGAYSDYLAARVEYFVEQFVHYGELGARVMDQATRRVLGAEKVPNDEKLFSIFEPHTELLKRGKAGKPIEFGHMVLLQQTGEKFISDFDVFEKKPVEHGLVNGVLASHKRTFGALPSTFTADKGFYENMDAIGKLEKKVELVAIAKKGARTDEEVAREHSLAFKLAQAFRAGIEGSISFLKRALRMHRCFNMGWEHYVSTVGATVFAHNLLVLVRDTS
jgi:IS5 family transposase